MERENIIKAALEKDFEKYWSNIQEADVECSEAFDIRMQGLFASLDKEEKEVITITKIRKQRFALKQLIAAALTLILMVAWTTITVSAYRSATAGFSMTITPYGLKIGTAPIGSSDVDSTPCEQIKSDESYIPDITAYYKISYYFENEHVVMVNFEDDEGNIIEYSQRVLSVNEYIKDTRYELQRFRYDDIDYIYFVSEGKNTLLWNDYGYSFSLSSYTLDREQLKNYSLTLVKLSKYD